MRFFEIHSPRLLIKSSDRFEKNFAVMLRSYPAAAGVLSAFLKHKIDDPRQPFGKKDAPFIRSGPLGGYFHFHLIHGRMILVYDVKDGAIRLYDVMDHRGFEGRQAASLAAFLKGASVSDYVLPSNEALSGEDKQELVDLFYHIAADEPDVIRQALGGSWEDLMVYIEMTVDTTDAEVFASFGGQAELAIKLGDILKEMGHK